jgi:hypothetical protein
LIIVFSIGGALLFGLWKHAIAQVIPEEPADKSAGTAS